jgi:hypothetical protein
VPSSISIRLAVGGLLVAAGGLLQAAGGLLRAEAGAHSWSAMRCRDQLSGAPGPGGTRYCTA